MAAPLYHRLFISREPIDETVAEQAVATALAAAAAGLFGSVVGAQ